MPSDEYEKNVAAQLLVLTERVEAYNREQQAESASLRAFFQNAQRAMERRVARIEILIGSALIGTFVIVMSLAGRHIGIM